MTMVLKLKVHEIFRLSDGSTILACDKPTETVSWQQRRGKLMLRGAYSQDILFTGERKMLHQSSNFDKIAIETKDDVELDPDDVAAGRLELIL